ncbi:hypothetical protein ACF09C_19060 [Streptomyces sp. NPDC014870]|uniref:hypothetical protein n=1 Tax=Streptomyces sp. NPDC014870 TaxID=3364925 RepID=UPI0036FE7777
MKDFLSRLVSRIRRRTADPGTYVHPYSCPYIGGPTRHGSGERPLRGEDSPLVRPYLLAHEKRQKRRRVLLIAAHGPEIRPGVEVAA